MEEMVLAGDRGQGHLVVGVGGGGGGAGGGAGGGGDGGGLGASGVEGARGRAPPKQLRKKSVSFTGDESYQLLSNSCGGGGGQQGVTQVAKGGVSTGGTGKIASPMTVAPAATFFLRANRTTSPMVTPHTAYAVFAEKFSPHAASTATAAAATPASAAAATAAAAAAAAATTAATTDSWSSGGIDAAAHTHISSPPPKESDPSATEEGPTSANVTPPPSPRPVAAGGMEGGGVTPSSESTATTTAATATTTDSRVSKDSSDRGAAAAAGHKTQPGVDELTQRQRFVLDEEAVGRREGAGRGGVSLFADSGRSAADEERNRFGGSGAATELESTRAALHEGRRAAPSGGMSEAGVGGVAGLGRLEKTPPALYADVIDTEVEVEDEEEEEEEEEDDNNVGEEDSYELANNVGGRPPYNGGGGSRDDPAGGGEGAGYSPTEMHDGGCSGGGGGGGDRGQQGQGEREEHEREEGQSRESSSWSAVPESGGRAARGPRSRGRRDKWEIGDRYRFIRTLGRGSYGEVAQCEDLKEGDLVAIKRVLNVFNSEADAKRIYREMYILRHTRHNEIIHLRDVLMPAAFGDFRDLYLVFEFVDTDLYKLIGSPQFLTDEHVKLFLYQMLTGLKYVHSAHVIHRDIKPANVLLNEDCSLKICDFGLSRVVTQEPSTDPAPPPASVVTSTKAGKLACSPMKPPAATAAGAAAGAAATSHAAAVGGGGAGSGGGSSVDDDEPPVMPKRTLKRQLTKHVVTRWYRAPELILLQDYNNAVDMWSLGCILAELLSMQKESFPTSQERNALFPGKSCFPLSAEKPSSYSDALDQLNVIFDVIGTPSREDIMDLGEVRQYLARLPYKPPLDLGDKYAGASEAALDLLSSMLRFNPARRITITEALEHPYLASCRKPEKEAIASVPITMEFEHIATDKAALKRLIYEEVLHYHPDQAARFRDAALPATPSAAAADAAGATAAAAASTSRRRPAAEPEEPAVSDSSAAAAKRPAGDTAGLRLQEPDRKRYRLAIEGGGALAREHPMPTAAAKGSAAPDRSAAGAAAAAAVTAALGRSRAGDVEGVWRQ